MSIHFNEYNKNIRPLIESIEWNDTNLGPIHKWDIELRILLNTMFSSVQPACLYWGKDLNFFYNEPLIPIMGAGKHPLGFGRPGSEVHTDVWDMIKGQVVDAYETGNSYLNEDQLVPKFGASEQDEFYFTFSYSPVYCGDGSKILGVYCSVTETTDRVLSIKKEKLANAAKSSFIANMSHEIRTPLGIIMGYTELLRIPQTQSSLQDTYTEAILRNTEHLQVVIDNILDYSKIEAQEIHTEILKVNLRDLLNEVVTSMQVKADEKGLSLSFEIEENVPAFIGTDPTRLKQILLNIVSNALKFTAFGGCSIRVKKSTKQAKQISFEIEDSGIGLNNKQISRLFKPFSQADVSTTRKYGGTGLGLAISKRLALLLGGDITILSSKPHQGTIFELSIEDMKLTKDKKGSEITHTKTDLEVLNTLTILVVDDASENLKLVTRILEPLGAKVLTASNGQEGVDIALGERPDLILMDVQMPLMDGYAATSLLRQMNYTGRIIVFSAHAKKEASEEALSYGANAYMTKPFKYNELISKISSFFIH